MNISCNARPSDSRNERVVIIFRSAAPMVIIIISLCRTLHIAVHLWKSSKTKPISAGKPRLSFASMPFRCVCVCVCRVWNVYLPRIAALNLKRRYNFPNDRFLTKRPIVVSGGAWYFFTRYRTTVYRTFQRGRFAVFAKAIFTLRGKQFLPNYFSW